MAPASAPGAAKARTRRTGPCSRPSTALATPFARAKASALSTRNQISAGPSPITTSGNQPAAFTRPRRRRPPDRAATRRRQPFRRLARQPQVVDDVAQAHPAPVQHRLPPAVQFGQALQQVLQNDVQRALGGGLGRPFAIAIGEMLAGHGHALLVRPICMAPARFVPLRMGGPP
jgi:hypothetical protein